jgi:hypothetical protein
VTRARIHDAKWPVVWDMFCMLGVGPDRFAREPVGHEATIPEVQAELAARGGFVPLMHLFPREEDTRGLSIPWTRADGALREWADGSAEYQAAAAAAAAWGPAG